MYRGSTSRGRSFRDPTSSFACHSNMLPGDTETHWSVFKQLPHTYRHRQYRPESKCRPTGKTMRRLVWFNVETRLTRQTSDQQRGVMGLHPETCCIKLTSFFNVNSICFTASGTVSTDVWFTAFYSVRVQKGSGSHCSVICLSLLSSVWTRHVPTRWFSHPDPSLWTRPGPTHRHSVPITPQGHTHAGVTSSRERERTASRGAEERSDCVSLNRLTHTSFTTSLCGRKRIITITSYHLAVYHSEHRAGSRSSLSSALFTAHSFTAASVCLTSQDQSSMVSMD